MKLGVDMFKTRFTELAGITYPIMQGGMQHLGTPELAAAVSNAGGLGTINAATYPDASAFDNALKISRNEPVSKIDFGSLLLDERKVYFIKDNGVGFDMKYVDKIFGAFQRLHSTSEFEGTGIGLATVNRIIRRHHGTIWVESEINKGTTFFFTF